MCEKDYNLLRPFDLEAAKRGEAITCNALGTILHYVAGPDVGGKVCVKYECGEFGLYKPVNLSMAPLCLVEGKPVYKGDVLYYKQDVGSRIAGEPRTVSGFANDCLMWQGGGFGSQRNLTWTPPKVKREGWVNIYESYQYSGMTVTGASAIFLTRKDADDAALKTRKTCIHIEWEE